MSLIDPNHPTRRMRRALGLKTILGSDYPGESFPDLPEKLRPFLPETGRIGTNPPELQSGPESSSRNEPPRGAPETEPGPIGLPDGFFKVPGIFLNFVRIINAAIVFLSIADRLDRAITNPRTIKAFRESIPRLIDVRDKFIDRVGELRGELYKIT